MRAMPPDQVDKMLKADFAEKMDELNVEYNELEPYYDKVIKRLEADLSM